MKKSMMIPIDSENSKITEAIFPMGAFNSSLTHSKDEKGNKRMYRSIT